MRGIVGAALGSLPDEEHPSTTDDFERAAAEPTDMPWPRLRKLVLGEDLDVGNVAVLGRVTVGVVVAWVIMGGDLLGSCVYGPDVLGRADDGNRAILLVVTALTLLALALLAFAYTRMIVHFPHGGGGYSAARHTVSDRLALVSGVALVVDAALNVAVSVVTCVHAASDALHASWHLPETLIAAALIVGLMLVNLRGAKESVVVLAPIVGLFVVTHLGVLGLALVQRGGELPSAVAAVPGQLHLSVARHGLGGTLWLVLRAFALGGAIYTGLESVSNGVPLLREPKVPSARRTMLLVVGIPAVIIGALLLSYFLDDVRARGAATLNALLFGKLAGADASPHRHFLLVTLPLWAEAILLLQAAQTGFVDGPRVLGALATDHFVPRQLARLNGRLAPAPGILVITGLALVTTFLAGGALEPLVITFVVSVFVTFSISQWAMLRHALRRRGEPAWRRDAATHGLALLVCVVILAATVTARWRPSLVALALIAGGTAFALRVRRRYRELRSAIETKVEQPSIGVPEPSEAPPLAILVLPSRAPAVARWAIGWLRSMPLRISELVLAAVAPVDAEAFEGRLRQLERDQQRELEEVAADARQSGLRVSIELRRGADVVETEAALVLQLLERRRTPAVIFGFRVSAAESAVDPLLRDDDALRLQTRLGRERLTMTIVSIPLAG